VNWKFWKRDEPLFEFVIDSKEIPTSTLFRWFCYDSGVDIPNKFAEAVGFHPISSEGEEMELKESTARLRRVEPYKEFIDLISTIAGEIMSKTTQDALVDEKMFDEEEQFFISEMYAKMAQVALVPAFSAALELGLVVNPGTYIGTEYLDEF